VVIVVIIAAIVVAPLPLERPHFVHFCILSTITDLIKSNPIQSNSIQSNQIELNGCACTAD
jgi:hypothetical protein